MATSDPTSSDAPADDAPESASSAGTVSRKHAQARKTAAKPVKAAKAGKPAKATPVKTEKKAAPAKKATPGKKTAPAKKATAAKKTAAKKTAPGKRTAPGKKTAPAKKANPVSVETPLVPIGHYGGLRFTAGDIDNHTHELRIGPELLDLSDEEFLTWVAAHGDPRRLDEGTRWRREEIEAAATTVAVENVPAVLNSLLDRGLVFPVPDDPAYARRFAAYHRLIPLTTGLGNAPSPQLAGATLPSANAELALGQVPPSAGSSPRTARDTYQIGPFGAPFVRVPAVVYEVWAFGHLEPNLWAACRRVAAGLDPSAPAGAADADMILRTVLDGLHQLLTSNVAYLDRALAGSPAEFVKRQVDGAAPTPGSRLLPVGHYLGRNTAPGGSDETASHLIRIGAETTRLTHTFELAAWILAHGADNPRPDRPWTRAAAINRGVQLPDVGNVSVHLEALRGRGQLVEVDPADSAALRAFAATYRLRSMMVGLGNTLVEPHRYGVGFPGAAPVVLVDVRAYELWQWGHLADSLWEACDLAAAHWREDGSTAADDADALAQLRSVFTDLCSLIAYGCAYLDHAQA